MFSVLRLLLVGSHCITQNKPNILFHNNNHITFTVFYINIPVSPASILYILLLFG
jgi:hypothetical protein